MMLALPNEGQLALARGVADFLGDAFPVGRFRAQGASDVERWGELAKLGIFGMTLAEEEDGLGLSAAEEALVARELGRALVTPAVLAAMIAPVVAERAGDAGLRDTLLAGARRVGLALGVIEGEARVVDNADGLFLLVDGERLRLIESTGRPLDGLDATLRLTAAPLPGTALADVVAPELALAAHVIAAGFLTGTLETTRDMAADYARSREQFGRPIGAFQAIKHRCADAALGAELSWAQLWTAASALARGAPDAEFHARAAKWLAGDEALKAARFNIQAHGGMGFTQELDAQLILKRTHVLHQMFGNPRLAPARLAALPVEV